MLLAFSANSADSLQDRQAGRAYWAHASKPNTFTFGLLIMKDLTVQKFTCPAYC